MGNQINKTILPKIIYSLFLSLFFLMSCNQKSKSEKHSEIVTKNKTDEFSKGFQLLETYCFSCHSPNASQNSRIAPPMEAIKKHYVQTHTTQEQFEKDLIVFINNPSIDNSKMPGAIKKFNLMPKMSFTDKQLKSIANYIFNSELEKPNWFEEHYKKEKKKHNTIDTDLSLIEKGQNIAMRTKGVLGKNLLNAINTKGTENALSFCSSKAMFLTDSMATVLNAKIKRVSDKNRNPKNIANEEELKYIAHIKEVLAKGEKPKPKATEIEGKQLGYYPIVTNKMCMQCHGQPKAEILASTYTKIKKIYPNDRAIGYKENELRGIWVIEMNN